MASGRLRLDHPEWMLTLGADVRFGSLDQILQPSIWGVWNAWRWLGRAATRNSVVLLVISGRYAIPW
jgi:hypothetical protein